MKNFRKKIATVMTIVLIVSVMAISASAASVSYSYIGNGVLTNYGYNCPSSNGGNSLSGLDINKLRESLGISGNTAQVANLKSGNVSNASGGTPNCPNNGSSQASDAITKANDYATNAPSNSNTETIPGTAAPNASASNGGNNNACTKSPVCSTAPTCTVGSCPTVKSQYGTTTCNIGTTCSGSNTIMERLNGIFAKCGIDLQKACISLAGNGDADVTENSQLPTSNTTPPAVDNSSSASSDGAKVDNMSYEQQVTKLVNEQRTANGLAPLTLNTELSNVARVKSQDMHDNNYFSHTSPTYGSPFDMLKTFGISNRAAGENIAMGYATPEAVMNGWMNSAGHKANIMNANYTQIGVGYDADGNYWTQEFIG